MNNKNKLKFVISLATLQLWTICFGQTYPNGGANNASNNASNSAAHSANLPANSLNANPSNAQRLQPNIIISYPVNSPGAGTQSGNQNTGASALKRPLPEKPVNPGYDTNSSLGGPANNQGSITYGSNGSIKTQAPNLNPNTNTNTNPTTTTTTNTR